MTTYCTIKDVQGIVDTDMTPTEIGTLISIISAVMDDTTDTSKHALVLRGICQLWTAYRVMLKDPNARALGGYSENRGTTLKLMKDELDFMLKIGSGGIAFTPASESLG